MGERRLSDELRNELLDSISGKLDIIIKKLDEINKRLKK